VSGDKLVIYGVFMACIALVFLLYMGCWRLKYSMYRFKKQGVSMQMMKSLGGFLGWNSFSIFCLYGRTHGMSVVLNLFFGPGVNAAYGISNQVGGQLLFFSNNMLKALNPQIVKSEGAGNRTRAVRLALMGSKYGFFLFALFSIPCLFEMEGMLNFWLKQVPAHAVMFCRIILLGNLFRQLTIGLAPAISATGNIKNYHLQVGVLLLINIPVAIALFYWGFGLMYVMSAYVVIDFLAFLARIFISKKVLLVTFRTYLDRVLLKLIIPTLIYSLCCFVIVYFIHFSGRFFLTGLACAPIFLILIYFFGTESAEKILGHQAMYALKRKIFK